MLRRLQRRPRCAPVPRVPERIPPRGAKLLRGGAQIRQGGPSPALAPMKSLALASAKSSVLAPVAGRRRGRNRRRVLVQRSRATGNYDSRYSVFKNQLLLI